MKRKLDKNTYKALKSANSLDDLIERFAQPDTRCRRMCKNLKVTNILKSGKPYMSEWYGMVSPVKINISKDTLAKLKRIDK